MSSLVCSGCGSALVLPSDLTAQDVACGFCPVRTPLPADLLDVRLREQQEKFAEQQKAVVQGEVGAVVRKTTTFIIWFSVLSVAVPLIATVAIFAVMAYLGSHASHPSAAPAHAPPSHGSHPH